MENTDKKEPVNKYNPVAGLFFILLVGIATLLYYSSIPQKDILAPIIITPAFHYIYSLLIKREISFEEARLLYVAGFLQFLSPILVQVILLILIVSSDNPSLQSFNPTLIIPFFGVISLLLTLRFIQNTKP